MASIRGEGFGSSALRKRAVRGVSIPIPLDLFSYPTRRDASTSMEGYNEDCIEQEGSGDPSQKNIVT